MERPKVYIETSIISYLTARPSNDIRVVANQNTTIEWWDSQRPKFTVLVSAFVTAEASLGHPDAVQRRLKIIAEIPELEATEEVRIFGQALISQGAIPTKAEIDAYHVAIAAVNGVEYLLTWNCAHIANALMRPKIESICRSCGYEPPVICTPQELMEN